MVELTAWNNGMILILALSQLSGNTFEEIMVELTAWNNGMILILALSQY